MRVSVDTDLCCGAGQCVLAVPEVFDQRDEDGIVLLLVERPSEDLHEEVRTASQVCPAGAIRIHEE
jgi:ferredoxin